MQPSVSICIASHNQGHLLSEAIYTCVTQDYENIEIVVLDDASTDGTKEMFEKDYDKIKYFRSEEASGTGGAFNKAIEKATGDIIVLLCSDDIFLDKRVISDIVRNFKNKEMGHISRYYYQFLDGKDYPVRAWHENNVIELANNPSGLAFRREALKGLKLTNKMFVESPTLVSKVISKWKYTIMPYDTVGIRIHASTARSKDYYAKRWVSSPVEEWVKIGGDSILKDFTSLIQIKNYFTTAAVWKEIRNYAKLRPINLLNPGFWFFAGVSLFTPRFILWHVPHWYRVTLGRFTTRAILRP